MKKADLVITSSLAYEGMLSLRRRVDSETVYSGKDVRQALQDAGFEAGEKVVLITEEEYERMHAYSSLYCSPITPRE